MWQFVTREAGEAPVSAKTIRSLFSIRSAKPEYLGDEQHALTHRRYEFAVYHADTRDDNAPSLAHSYAWVPLDRLHEFPLPRPHLKIAGRLRARTT